MQPKDKHERLRIVSIKKIQAQLKNAVLSGSEIQVEYRRLPREAQRLREKRRTEKPELRAQLSENVLETTASPLYRDPTSATTSDSSLSL